MNKVQVLLYTSYLHTIGGIETFVDNWVEILLPHYDIGLYCPQMPTERLCRLSQTIPVFKGGDVECDTLVMIRIGDAIPKGVKYKKSVRMCHACRSNPAWHILDDCDRVIHVSEASKHSFSSDGDVILNPVVKRSRDALILVSATRIPAMDKGKNADRMIKLAEMLNDADVPFVWLNFSDSPLSDAPRGMVNVGMTADIQSYIARADYLVQLSDQEGFGYSVAEALINHTAVICTPFKTTAELGVVDGKNGYILPFDMNYDVTKLLNVPGFEYKYDNKPIIRAWRKVLGNTKPKHDYTPPEMVDVVARIEYRDIMLNRVLNPGDAVAMPYARAMELIDKGFVTKKDKKG